MFSNAQSDKAAGARCDWFGARFGMRRYVLIFSLAFNIGFCAHLAYQWLTPPSPYRSPEERMEVYLRYLPQSAWADYRERVNARLGTVIDLHKQVHVEREAFAGLLTKDPFDKAALYAEFQKISAMNQKISAIYQQALVDEEASITPEERMKSYAIITGFLKRDPLTAQ